MRGEKRQKSVLVGLALLCALVALYFQRFEFTHETGSYGAKATFRSLVLGNTVPADAVIIKASQLSLREEFRGRFDLEKVDEDPTLLRLEIGVAEPEEVEERMNEAIEALNGILTRLASAETERTAQKLRQIERPQAKERRRALPETPEQKPALTRAEHQSALRLRVEIDDLTHHLQGGREPVWLAGRLDRSLFQQTENDLRKAESELIRLQKTFTPQSRAVKAQELEVGRLRSALSEEKLHLTKLLLTSYRADLNELEEKAFATIKSNVAARAKAEEPLEDGFRSPSSDDWLSATAESLEKESAAQKSAALLKRVGEIVITENYPDSYWLRMALWLSSAVLLLLSLFRPEQRSDGHSPSIVPGSDAKGQPHRISAVDLAESPPFEPEPHLLQLLGSIKNQHGSAAKRYLVLGSSRGDSRPVTTVRLAGTLSAKGELVRLVDFDLQDKLLSLKLGNYHTAGVADLLASLKVPPEEFLAPLSGTTIEFAPAGMCTLADIPTEASDNLAQLLSPPKNGTLIVEAGFDSPVQVLLEHVEAVICVAAADKPWTPHQQKVLLEIKEARKPIWGLFQGGSGIFPFE